MIFFQTKMLFKEFLIWAFWGQTVGPIWVKNCKIDYFHTSHVTTTTQFFSPKNKVLNSHSLLTKQTKR